jgi:hypothetical protein
MSLDTVDMIKMIERKNKIEQYKDQLVEMVEEFFNGRDVPDDLGYTQFQDLLSKANMTTSVKEITNFIQYQCGRDKKKGWSSDSFGPALITAIEEIAKKETDDRELRIELVRLFLGYFLRYARYKKPS